MCYEMDNNLRDLQDVEEQCFFPGVLVKYTGHTSQLRSEPSIVSSMIIHAPNLSDMIGCIIATEDIWYYVVWVFRDYVISGWMLRGTLSEL